MRRGLLPIFLYLPLVIGADGCYIQDRTIIIIRARKDPCGIVPGPYHTAQQHTGDAPVQYKGDDPITIDLEETQ